MVAPPLTPAQSTHRWWAYLGASVALNLLLATALGWGRSAPIPPPAMLKVHLVAHDAAARRAAPKPAGEARARNPSLQPAGAAAQARAGRVLQKARTRRQVPPAYPPRARELGQQGLVVLHAAIAANGALRRVQVARSSGYPLLDGAASAAVRQWEFEPLRLAAGQAVQWVRVPVRFVIEP